MSIALTVFQGRAGDRNGLGTPGAAHMGNALAKKLSVSPQILGNQQAVPYVGWEEELAEARPGLSSLVKHFEQLLTQKTKLVTALPRCAAAIATIPTVARHHPEACIIWFDAHADLNTPTSSPTGYLGGMVLTAAAGQWTSGLGEGLKLENLILAGVRDIDAPEHEVINRYGVTALGPSEEDMATLHKAIAGRPVYMHIDCDVLDPSLVATEYQCPNGLSLEQLNKACTIIAEHQVLGLEIAEFQTIRNLGEPEKSPETVLKALEPILLSLQN